MSQTNERRRELYKHNREDILARNRDYRVAHKEKITAWQKEYRKVYYSSNRDAIKAAAIEYKESTKYSYRHIKLRLLRFAKYRAKKNNLPFNLSLDDFEIPKYCPVLGIELKPSVGSKNMECSPTLDKVIPSLGYVKGNVQVISHRANTIKRDASLDELEKLVCYLRRLTQ
jgi:hypothetical protein